MSDPKNTKNNSTTMIRYNDSISGLKAIKSMDYLNYLSNKYNCPLTINSHDIGFLRETIYFTFTGSFEQIDNIKKHIAETLLQYHIDKFQYDDAKIRSGSVTQMEDCVQATFEVPKFNNICDFTEKLNKHLKDIDIKITYSEKSLGFFKGDVVTLETKGTKKRMDIFIEMILKNVQSIEPIKVQQKSNMKM